MILSTTETTDLRAIFPQKPLQFLRIQAIRELAKIYEADKAGGQTPAVTEDLDASVLI